MTDQELEQIRALLTEKYPESASRWKEQRLAGLRLLAELDRIRVAPPVAGLGTARQCTHGHWNCVVCRWLAGYSQNKKVRP